MARYQSYGGLDDAPVQDGDIGFVGVNLRLPTWQLPAGMLALSENGRIDGAWVPRRGCDVVTEGSLSTGSPLRLPFWLVDEAAGYFIVEAERVGELVTITTFSSHGLPVGGTPAGVIINPSGSDNSILYTAIASGTSGSAISIAYTESADPYQDISVAVNGNEITASYGSLSRLRISGSLTYDGVNPLVFPLFSRLGPLNNSRPQYMKSGIGVIYWDSSKWIISYYGSPFAAWESTEDVATPDLVTTWIPQSPATGNPILTVQSAVADDMIAAINGDAVSSLLVSAASSGTTTGVLAPVSKTFLQGGASGTAYLGLELVLAPFTADPNGVWEMTPIDADGLTFSIPGATGSETYDAASARVLSRIDDAASSNVLGSCLFSDPSSLNEESIFLAFGSSVKQVMLTDGSVNTYGLPGSDTIDSEVDMIQAMDRVLIFRAGLAAYEWRVGDTDFSEVPSGPYVQPQVFTVTGTFVDVVSGKCTITGLTNTTVSVNDPILIYATTNANFTEFVGETYFVIEADATSFSFYIPVQNISTIGADTLSLGRQVSLGGGFIHQPAFPWAIYFQRRIWGPYWYDWSTVPTPDAFVDRNIRDELVASDILDSDTYDPIYNQFRITPGAADYIVALHPYSDDKLLVLNRNSIHQIQNTRGSLDDTTVNELTREIGCLSRRSVVTQGNAIFFLSDNGVYVLEFFNDYNLRGMEKPLSEAIQPYIDRISTTLAMDSVGIYFNNRYWLAVPLDSSPGEGDAVGNNAILVFNMLNREWESVDTFGDSSFVIDNFIIGTAGIRNDLYAVTATGGIHVLDRLDEDYDVIATNFVTGSGQFPISARLRSRAYMCETVERKRFTRIGMQMKSGSAQSDVGLVFTAEDPDNVGSEDLVSSGMSGPLEAGNTADVRQRLGGIRGFNGQIEVLRKIGRPAIRSLKLDAAVANRATLTQK